MVNRTSLPRWVNASIDAIADAPDSWIGRLAARRLGSPAPAGTVSVTRFADLPSRVLIAPVNYSGQGTAWARALEHHDPSISARNMAIDVPGGFSFEADLVVPQGTYHNDADWQRRQFAAAARATHVLVEAEEPPFGRLLGRSVAAQVGALAERGVNTAFLAHGTDVRLPSSHMVRQKWSHYADPAIFAPRAETIAQRNIDFLLDSGRPLFVSTPDLLVDLPSATWCPVVVDAARWASEREEHAGPLRVAHAPSVGTVKGTDLVLPALTKLVADGIISLDIVHGVASAEMPAVFARADIVLDQFRVGSYGVAACEAMASGCIVIGHVTSDVRSEIARQTGRELPIVEATPETIEAVLRGLAEDPRLSATREAGRDFISAVHSGTRSAEVLIAGWIARDTDSMKGGL